MAEMRRPECVLSALRASAAPVVAIVLAGMALPATANTPDLSTAERINAAATDFLEDFRTEQEALGREIAYDLGSVDPRLNLADCTEPLAVEFSGDPMRTTRATLQVACRGEQPWRIFLKANVEIQAEGWVSRRAIARGAQLDRGMLEATTVTLNTNRRSGLTDPEDMIGMLARRNINAGTPITPNLLEAPEDVSRGDRVIIRAGGSTFSIQTRGEAQRGGHVGDQITVINENSGRSVRARITGPGEVDINR